MFELHVLPAAQGDCLLLAWARNGEPAHHLLIDAGPVNNAVRDALLARLEQLAVTRVELLVVTHIDGDHIAGVMRMMDGDDPLPFEVGDVWFNAFRHLPDDGLGEAQAEALTASLDRRGLPWNAAFGGGAVQLPDPGTDPDDAPPLPTFELPGGLRVTVVGPTRARLAALVPEWRAHLIAAGMLPADEDDGDDEPAADDTMGDDEVDLSDLDALAATPFEEDDSEPNASSIMLLAEFGDDAVLLTGDGLADDIVAGLRRLAAERGAPVAVGTLKLPHHGSRANVSTELVEAVAARRHVVSTNGRVYDHPDAAAIARIIVSSAPGVELCFNHRNEESVRWDDDELRQQHGYRTIFPAPDEDGIVVDLTAPVDL